MNKTKLIKRVAWHNSGMIIFLEDNRFMPYLFRKGLKRRLTDNEVKNMSLKELCNYPGAQWKRFAK